MFSSVRVAVRSVPRLLSSSVRQDFMPCLLDSRVEPAGMWPPGSRAPRYRGRATRHLAQRGRELMGTAEPDTPVAGAVALSDRMIIGQEDLSSDRVP